MADATSHMPKMLGSSFVHPQKLEYQISRSPGPGSHAGGRASGHRPGVQTSYSGPLMRHRAQRVHRVASVPLVTMAQLAAGPSGSAL
eukprot:3167499-Prymnesium_polylepis.1